jgi:hypothetical protein
MQGSSKNRNIAAVQYLDQAICIWRLLLLIVLGEINN